MSRVAEIHDVAGTVSRETIAALEAFEAAFLRWTARINLAAPATLEDLWRRHVADSAQLVGLKPDARRWLDLGSGGGFPGAVVAILLRDTPGVHVDLVESNRKKAAFLQNVLTELEAPAAVHACRIEDTARLGLTPEIVTARALAPLDRLLALAEHWLSSGAVGVFHKGRDFAAEIAKSRDVFGYDLIEHVSKVDAAGRILEIADLRRVRRRQGQRDSYG